MSHSGAKKKYQLYGRGGSSTAKSSGFEKETDSSYGGSTPGLSPSSSVSNISVTSPESGISYSESSVGMSPRSVAQEYDSLYGSLSMGRSPISIHSMPVNSPGCSSSYDYSLSPSSLPFQSPLSPPLYESRTYPAIPAADLSQPFRNDFLSVAGPSLHLPSDRHREQRRLVADSTTDQIPSTFPADEDAEASRQVDTRPKQKRTQKCRMCANHDLIVDVKGHKWYCQYRNCECPDCDVTRKCQKYMKERQKLTRYQQQQLQSGALPTGIPDPPRRESLDEAQTDFPREKEMVSETEDILDFEFLEKVNQICRPKNPKTGN